MSTAEQVRNYVGTLSDGALFATSNVRNYGSRGAVDQALYRMIAACTIQRVCRGLFMKSGTEVPKPSVAEVAKAKAAAFLRNVYVHAGSALAKLGADLQTGGEVETVFATDGPSTSFKYGTIRIVLKRMAPRKLHKKDSTLGLMIRGLWSLGQSGCTEAAMRAALNRLSTSERLSLNQLRAQMPEWLARKLLS